MEVEPQLSTWSTEILSNRLTLCSCFFRVWPPFFPRPSGHKNLGKTWPFFGLRQPWYHRMKRVTLQEMNLHEFMAASRSKRIQTTLYSSFTTKLTVSSMRELVMVVACGPVQRSSPPSPVQWLLTAINLCSYEHNYKVLIIIICKPVHVHVLLFFFK